MPKLPRITGKEILAALKRAGFTQTRVTGSHYHLLNPAKTNLVTVPMHSGEIVPPKTLQSILKQAGLTVEEFISLL